MYCITFFIYFILSVHIFILFYNDSLRRSLHLLYCIRLFSILFALLFDSNDNFFREIKLYVLSLIIFSNCLHFFWTFLLFWLARNWRKHYIIINSFRIYNVYFPRNSCLKEKGEILKYLLRLFIEFYFYLELFRMHLDLLLRLLLFNSYVFYWKRKGKRIEQKQKKR